MKIRQINTHTYGGAAIVAKRIHMALLDCNIDSLLITKFGVRNDFPAHRYFKDGRLRNRLLKIITNPTLSPMVEFLLRMNQHPNLANRPSGFEIFSTWCNSYLGGIDDSFKDCDVVHFHWINDFFNYTPFIQKFKDKKFVWTLHDMNPITGGCHHSDGCMKFETACVQCPQLANTIDENYSKAIQDLKIAALKPLRDDQLTIVSPSVWLSELSQKSKITKRFNHVIIQNPSFPDVPLNTSRDDIKRKLGLPTDKKIIMFASGNLNNTRKGLGLLFHAVRSMKKKNEIVLLGIGHKTKPEKGLHIIYTGSLSNVELLANYYYASDIFVTPTLAENSPLVVIESLCCGTPVVASRVGGIPDLVNESNGILFKTGDYMELQQAIHQALFQRSYNRHSIRNEALSFHSPSKIAADYVALYRALLG
jgi:glycosyltransferase involved in cell wall biosynthesis